MSAGSTRTPTSTYPTDVGSSDMTSGRRGSSSPEALEMSQQHNEQIEGMDQMLDMLTDAIRQPLSDAIRRSVIAGRRSVARLFADDLLREAICRAGRFRAGLQSIAEGGNQEGYTILAIQRIDQLLERLVMLQRRHREWVIIAPPGVAPSDGSVGGPAEAG